MLSKQEVFAHYGSLFLRHEEREDCAHRYVFKGIADDGVEVRVYHSPNVAIWEDFVKRDLPVSLNDAPDYRVCEIRRGEDVEFQDLQGPVF
jgi:hypothetical protein